LISYATVTGTKRNLCALRTHGWRLLVVPSSAPPRVPRWETGNEAPFMLDNGAWGAFARGRPWNADHFLRAVDVLGFRADAIVAPDIVCGGQASLDLTLSFLPRLRGVGAPILIAVQNGMVPTDLPPLGPGLGLFIGGDDRWKEDSARMWGAHARAAGAPCHMARVNTCRRIYLAAEAGCSSFDGTSCSRFAVNVPRLTNARRALPLDFVSSNSPSPRTE
jgi:hypothetical protein